MGNLFTIPSANADNAEELFNQLDINKSGEISLDDLKQVLKEKKLVDNDEEITKIFHIINVSNTGVIDIHEFRDFFQNIKNDLSNFEKEQEEKEEQAELNDVTNYLIPDIIEIKNISISELIPGTKSYIIIKIDNIEEKLDTSKDSNPTWNKKKTFYINSFKTDNIKTFTPRIIFEIWEKNTLKNKQIGSYSISLSELKDYTEKSINNRIELLPYYIDKLTKFASNKQKKKLPPGVVGIMKTDLHPTININIHWKSSNNIQENIKYQFPNKLRVRILDSKGLEEYKPYLTLKLSKHNEKKTKTKRIKPYSWDEKFNFDTSLTDNLEIQVKHSKIGIDTVLGKQKYNLLELTKDFNKTESLRPHKTSKFKIPVYSTNLLKTKKKDIGHVNLKMKWHDSESEATKVEGDFKVHKNTQKSIKKKKKKKKKDKKKDKEISGGYRKKKYKSKRKIRKTYRKYLN